MLELLESLEDKIQKGQDIDEIAEELSDAVELACDEGELPYSTKNEVLDLIGKINESYNYDSEDTTISTDLIELKELVNDL